jgi:hypothetical protein
VVKAKAPEGSKATSSSRNSQERLAEALRENLLRRKAQKRARGSSDMTGAVASSGKVKGAP